MTTHPNPALPADVMPSRRVCFREILSWANDVREAHRRDPITLKEVKELLDAVTAAVEADRTTQSAALAATQSELAETRRALAPLDAIVHALGIEDSDDDPAECVKAQIAALAAARAENDKLRESLTELVRAVETTVNEKGGGGFILARLSDARAALAEGG